MPTAEKSDHPGEVWKDLPLPDGDHDVSGKKQKKASKKYRDILESYRTKAFRFHKELLKKKRSTGTR
jgi:hypothetical protein